MTRGWLMNMWYCCDLMMWMFVIYPFYVLHRYFIWAYSHPFYYCSVCAPLEDRQLGTRVPAWVRGRCPCLFSYLLLSLRGVIMICRNGMFRSSIICFMPYLCWSFVIHLMLKLLCQLNDFSMLSFNGYVVVMFLCYGESCMTF